MKLLQILLIFSVLFPVLSQTGYAKNEDQYLLSEDVYESLLDINKLIEDEKFRKAEEKASDLFKNNLSAYEEAVLNQTLGYIYNSLEQYSKSIDVFTKALESGALPEKVSNDLNYIVAQLHAQEGNYEKSIDYLTSWFDKTQSADAESHIFAASVYYQLNRYKEMIPHIKQALKSSENPEKNWYELLFVAYYETEQYDNAAEILENMLSRYPNNNNYWLQLANTYQQGGNTRKAIAVYELADKKGLLGQQEIIQLASLYLNDDIPHKAATFLQYKMDMEKIERSIDNLQILATSWLLAKEEDKAIEVITDIARITNDPRDYLRIGQIYFNRGEWSKAIISLEEAIGSKDAEESARANLLLGIAAYYHDDISLSGRALNKAATNKKTAEQADWWLDKLRRKVKTETNS